MAFLKDTRRAATVSAALIAASFLVGALLYRTLPETIVTHWGPSGEPNGTMAKPYGVFLLPFVMAAVTLLLFSLPKIDPLKNSYASFRKEYDRLIVLIVAFMTMMNGLVLAWNLGYRFNLSRFIAPAVGIFFYFLGTIMPGIKRNWFAGIRTPWTLSSDRVWQKTHEKAGSVFQLAGIVACFGAVVPRYAFELLVVPILAATLWVTFYSYLVYRKGE